MPLYSIEESLERSIAAILAADEALVAAGVSCVHADRSEEAALPKCVARAERSNELVPLANSGVFALRLTVSLTVPADDPDSDETQTGGADTFSDAWAAVGAAMQSDIREAVNDLELCHIWGVELEDSGAENGERSFVRSLSFRVFSSEVEPDE